MRFNTTTKIESFSGKYIILVDYGPEGLAVLSQHDEIEQAVLAVPFADGCAVAIVQLIDINISLASGE